MGAVRSKITQYRVAEWGLLSFFLLLLVSKNSIFYPTNDWVDANAFFTMGKAMMRGMVPYRDLFEQKGPLLYFIYGVGSLINSRGFIGIFLFEIMAMTTNLVCAFRIFKLYFSEQLSRMLTIFFPILLLNYYYFKQGGSAEEFCLPFLMILLNMVLTKIKQEEDILVFSSFTYIWQGFAVASVFLIKYTMLGPWIAFYIFLGIHLLLHKKWWALIQMMMFSLIGFLIGVIPWLIYFVIHDAMKDFIEVYFWVNTHSYNEEAISIFKRLFYVIDVTATNLKQNYTNFFIVFPGAMVIPAFKPLTTKYRDRFFILSLLLSGLFFVYMGMRSYEYYFLFLLPFGIFGFLLFGQLLTSLGKHEISWVETKANFLIPYSIICVILLLFGVNASITESIFFPANPTISAELGEEKRNAQELFAEYMQSKTSQPTLLNYMFLDGGFYLAANVLPTERHFELQNIDPNVYSENYMGQYEIVKNGQVDFVVVESTGILDDGTLEEHGIAEHYQFVMSHSQKRDLSYNVYSLFEKKK